MADSDAPVCCGEPMEVNEYDSDEDSYRYICHTNDRNHDKWLTDDSETWK